VTLTGSASVNSISVTGDTLSVSGGTLTVAANSSINSSSTLVLNNATLTLASGATLTNGGSITVNPLSSLNVGAAYTQTATGSLTLPSGTLLTSGVGVNLLNNGGFESPLAGTSTTTTPDDWGDWGPSYISTQYAHSGLQSVQTPGTSGGSGVNQAFSVTPGVSYTVSAYAMTPSTSKLTGAEEGILNLIFDNSSGTQVGTHGITVLTATSATGGPISGSVGGQGWNFYYTTGVAPSGAVTAYVALQVGPYSGQSGTNGGSVFWDDAQFGPTAATSAVVTAASLSNSGAITIGAADNVNIAEAFSQTGTGTLTMQLGGPASSLLFGTLSAGGTATLGGTLQAVLVNGYSPSINDSFTLLNYAAQTGAFSSTQLPSGASYAFQPAVNPTYLGIGALPTSLTTAVNIASVIDPASTNLLGVNLAYWDDKLTTAQTQSMVQAAGLDIFRFPGGSASDDYHFNQSSNDGDSSANTIPQFAQLIDNVGGLGIVTTDYGSGSPQEAEAELAYLLGSPTDTTTIGMGMEWSDSASAWQNVNWQTVGYWASLRAATPLAQDDGYNFLRIGRASPFTGINYWEVGNEQYGTWETDHYSPTGVGGSSTTSGGYNYPAAYAQFAASFSAFVTADKSLPSILIGIDSGDPTGTSDNNWTKNVLADGLADGFVPGFISDHSYMYGPGSESDSVLLNDTVSNPASNLDWSTRYSDYENILQQTVGAKASSVHIMATEYNSNYGTPGKQMTSLVNGLFVADSIGSLLDSGYTGGLFWDLRNGWGTNGDNSPTLFGWREGGDEGILGDPNYNDPPITGPYVPYPNYFGFQLASKMVQSGGTAVSAVSSYSELAVYSVLEANGHLDLMVINKNPDAAITEQFNLQGFTPSGQGQFWQYGEAQDYAQSQSPTGAASLANFSTALSFSGGSFSYAFPAYSMTVIDLTPTLSVATPAAANPNPVVGASVALSALGSENGSGTGLTYTWSATGPAPVTYTGATNGANAAKNITANFTQVGIYNFNVAITDTGGQTVNSAVQVIVLPVFASQSATTVTITLNNIAPIAVATSGSNVTVNEAGYQYSFTGVSAITVNGSAKSDVLNFNGPVALPFSVVNCGSSTVNVNGGTLIFAAVSGGSINLGTLFVANGAAAMITAATTQNPTTLNLGSLSIAASGVLDVTNNEVFISYAGAADPIAAIAGYITSGYNSGHWNGTGIISSAAQTPTNGLIYGLGYADGNDNVVSGLSSGQIEVKYTLLGDANLDGLVNAADFTILAANFNQPVTGWDHGDFNYDGLVNAADFTDLAANFNQSADIAAVANVASVAAAPVVVSTASAATTSTTPAASPASKSKPAKVSRPNVTDATNRKSKVSAVTTYAAGFVTIPTSGSTATPQNINRDAKFLADR
jgi:alpha-L-arabinofuranosidase